MRVCPRGEVLTNGKRGCRIRDTEAKYYADGEDAYDMKKVLKE
jgi:hypothetical protein